MLLVMCMAVEPLICVVVEGDVGLIVVVKTLVEPVPLGRLIFTAVEPFNIVVVVAVAGFRFILIAVAPSNTVTVVELLDVSWSGNF